MARFKSLEQQPSEARKFLAQMLERDLRASSEVYIEQPRKPDFAPEVVLGILSDVTLEWPRARDNAAQCITAAALPAGSLASVDELERLFLYRIVWGRLELPRGLTRGLSQFSPSIVAGVRALMALPREPHVALGERALELLQGLEHPLAQEVIGAPAEGRKEALRAFASRTHSPGWVSARLWDVARTGEGLRWWYERDDLLERPGSAANSPDEHWSRDQQEAIAEAVLDYFEAEPDLLGWPRERALLWRHMQLEHSWAEPEPPADWLLMPDDLPGRLEWLESAEQAAHDAAYRGREEIFSLMSFVVRFVERDFSREAPHSTVRRLVTLAVERPALWIALRWQLDRHPALLADLLLCVESTTWALRWIAERTPSAYSAWERDIVEDDWNRRRLGALHAACEVAIFTLTSAPGSAAQEAGRFLAKCLSQLHQRSLREHRGAAIKTNAYGKELWGALLDAVLKRREAVTSTLLVTVAEASRQAADATFGDSWSRTVLDILAQASSLLPLKDRTEAVCAVTRSYDAYIDSKGEQFEADPLPEALAAAFVKSSLDMPAAGFELAPVGKLRAAAARAGDDFKLGRVACAKARTQLRLLCRAVSGWREDSVPRVLVDALIAVLGVCVADGGAAGPLGVFAVAEDVTWSSGRTPTLAEEVARSVRHVPPERRSEVIARLAEVREPHALAAFAGHLHGGERAAIVEAAARVVDAPPSIRSLDSMRARVELMLSNGLYAEAEKLLAQEATLETWGPVRDRALWRFRNGLHVDLGMGRLEKLRGARVPPELAADTAHSSDANRALTFFSAIAELRAEGGDPQRAAEMFERLHEQHPDVSAYAVNLHAARLQALIRPGASGPRTPEEREALDALLVAGDALLEPYREGLVVENDATFEANRAILRLALGHNEAVLDDLAPYSQLISASDRLWSLRAIALARLGRLEEARASVTTGLRLFGPTTNMVNAQNELSRPSSLPGIELEELPLPLVRVRQALGELRLLSTEDQARVLGERSVHRFIVGRVRDACAMLTEFIPFMALMKGGVDERVFEEGLNELFRRLMRPMFATCGWSCPGEDPGGTTNSKWGSRDVTIERDGMLLALFEALRVSGTNAKAREAVGSHLRKLLRNSAACNLRFIMVWSFADEPAAVIEMVRSVAATLPEEVAGGSPRDLRRRETDSGPPGFVTLHPGLAGPVHIVWIVVDVAQRPQRALLS